MQPLRPVVRHLTSQFHRPRGPLGSLAGRIMSRRGSNVDRNLWMVDLFDLSPADRVLEIGPGPGVALAAAAERLPAGSLVAVDHSATMLRQTAARNRAIVDQGRLTLIEAEAEQLPAALVDFDVVYAMNVWHFWTDQDTVLAHLAAALRPGGRLAIGYQPRHRGATAADTEAGTRQLVDQFDRAGLIDVDTHQLAVDPPVVCAIGVRPR